MKNQKLSFEVFKSMPDHVQSHEVMQQIEGGSLFDCHGFWGRVGKLIDHTITDGIIREL